MDLEEFKFVYQDLRNQLKEIPSLPLLLKSIEKTTKKLDCINLYSLVDRRDFDFQLFQKDIFAQISLLLNEVQVLRQKTVQGSLNMSQIVDLEHTFQNVKQQKIEAFDKLNKLEEALQQELSKIIDQESFNNPLKLQNQIKEVEEDEEQNQQEQVNQSSKNEDKIEQLKKQIEELNKKIGMLNRGKGKWFEGDHNDFLKIYTKNNGDTQKVLQQGAKILGMKNAEIMDHIEVYQNYLQLQKEKKLVNEEFKAIREMQRQLKHQKQFERKVMKEQRQKINKRQKEEENLAKKMMIEEYKRKKNEQKQKLLKQIENEKEASKKVVKVSVQKKKNIEERNKRFVQQRQQMLKIKNSLGNTSQQKKGQKVKAKISEQIILKPKAKVPLQKQPESKV